MIYYESQTVSSFSVDIFSLKAVSRDASKEMCFTTSPAKLKNNTGNGKETCNSYGRSFGWAVVEAETRFGKEI